MRNFLILVAVLAAGFYLYTYPDIWGGSGRFLTGVNPAFTSGGITVHYAVRGTTRYFGTPGLVNRSVVLVDGSRWRLEVKTSRGPKIIVAVCDGTRTVSNLPPSSPLPLVKLHTTPTQQELLAFADRISSIAYPPRSEIAEAFTGPTIASKPIPIDFADPGTAEFFELNHTESIFGRFLSQ